MTNGVLDRLQEERAAQVTFIDETLARVQADGRDMVEAEQKNLDAAKQRIGKLDEQIDPLVEFEALREKHHEASAPVVPTRRRLESVMDRSDPTSLYGSPGAFLVDFMAARGYLSGQNGQRGAPDPEAARRVEYALQNQTTADTPGLLPHPIVGSVVSLIDANRPLITSVGGSRPMGGIPGKTFGRPKVTQHTTAGPQSAEKAELPTQKMIIGEVAFTKATYGGAVDVSRQDIDWTSPAAWDILVRDLADVYALTTEAAAGVIHLAAADDVNTATVVATNDLKGWSEALYQAAAKVYASAKRLPDRLWCSVNVWAAIGPIVDQNGRLPFGPGSTGDTSLESFAGNMLGIPRIVVPSWPSGKAVLGAASAFEVYEEAIGLLTAVEPSLLGVEVAYGGYMAAAAIAPEALAILTPPAGIPAFDAEAANGGGGADYGSMTVAELQAEAAERGLATSGTKSELADRLEADDSGA